MLLWRAHHITNPLGKLHRHVVDVLTVYPYHSVNSTDTWYLVLRMKYDACLVPGISWSLGKRVSFYRLVFSLSFYRFRYRYTEIVSVRYFLSYRFQTIAPKLPVRYPFLLFSCPRFWLSLYRFCSNHTIHTQTGVHSPMPSVVGMIPIRQLLNLALPPWGREGHFFLSYYYKINKCQMRDRRFRRNSSLQAAWDTSNVIP